MKTRNVIKIISVYLLLSALTCVFYLFLVIFKQEELNTLGAWFSVVVPGLIIGVTIFNAIDTLVSKRQDSLRRGSVINGVIFALQSITLFTDGFYYRYTQGNKLFFFINFEHLTKDIRWGIYFEPMVLDFNLKFDSSDNTLVGINFMALVLAVVSFWMAGIVKERLDIKE
ncbi:hypothetical protein [Parapedobacter koreensis]|uniref:Uncharacterized protein n=1 Tax=Parapedobacter koreensis TaxID=332977 RepID=A0A1H7UEB6_9SPHI|nr:hypothetical protein [Parapedobacter koreensis]SEL95159.1 hypothetical protein SAMN05421740_11514 [Parapedobacter koreensis]